MNFARKARRVARRQWRRGEMSWEDRQKVIEASRDPEIVAKWESQVKKQLGAPWEVEQGRIDWDAIWQWFIENWPTILKILLTLLAFADTPVTVDEPEDEDSE